MIIDRLQQLSEFQSARVIHAFWPIDDAGEVDTRPLIRQMLENDRRVVLPVVDFSSLAAPGLEHRELVDESDLQTNRWGIHEPQTGDLIPINEVDLVIVPALGADRSGHRVGYGGGFYDRFLGRISAPAVAVVYSACLTDRIAVEAHDVPVSIVVTESEVVRTGHE